tara:strand:+ start:102 stop:320 length:219 start_codon:yes stop_codon:yes gene_type:complete
MENCLDRLKPFIRENLENTKELYPNSYKRIITELGDNIVVSDISFGTLTTLTSYTDQRYILSILDLYNMFEK